MQFIIENVANMIFIATKNDVIFASWNTYEFTERKLKNAMKRIQACYDEPVEFIRTF